MGVALRLPALASGLLALAACAVVPGDAVDSALDAIHVAQHACKENWTVPDKYWAARRTNDEWRAWMASPTNGDPDAPSTYVEFDVRMDAHIGQVKECRKRDE